LAASSSSPTRFIILATQRTGSTWLTDLLDSHPAVASYEELLLPADHHRQTWGRSDKEFFHEYYARRVARRRWPLATPFWALRYLEELYAPRPGIDAIGMKLMYSQLKQYPWLLAYLVLRQVRVVHLVRTNLLDVVVSQETAQARGRYHAYTSEAVEQTAVELKTEQLVPELEVLQHSVDRIRLLLRLLPTPNIEISYEELGCDDAALDSVFSFLGVRPRRVTSRFAKLNRDCKQTLIANYQEVERTLRGTRFERFLMD
jgi:LPS sulfotransferase NodH